MADQLTVEHVEGVRFRTVVDGHELNFDWPPKEGGQDAGPSPAEVFVASIAACAGMYVRSYCNQKNLESAGMKVHAHWETSKEHGKHLGKLSMRVELPGEIPEEREAALMRVAEKCYLHRTLIHSPQIEISFEGHNPK